MTKNNVTYCFLDYEIEWWKLSLLKAMYTIIWKIRKEKMSVLTTCLKNWWARIYMEELMLYRNLRQRFPFIGKCSQEVWIFIFDKLWINPHETPCCLPSTKDQINVKPLTQILKNNVVRKKFIFYKTIYLQTWEV